VALSAELLLPQHPDQDRSEYTCKGVSHDIARASARLPIRSALSIRSRTKVQLRNASVCWHRSKSRPTVLTPPRGLSSEQGRAEMTIGQPPPRWRLGPLAAPFGE
jgi:hypothetical protein